jgi:hypothetical protein
MSQSIIPCTSYNGLTARTIKTLGVLKPEPLKVVRLSCRQHAFRVASPNRHCRGRGFCFQTEPFGKLCLAGPTATLSRFEVVLVGLVRTALLVGSFYRCVIGGRSADCLPAAIDFWAMKPYSVLSKTTIMHSWSCIHRCHGATHSALSVSDSRSNPFCEWCHDYPRTHRPDTSA